MDYDVGFPSFFGAVPDDPTATGRAATMIGQGKVEASPMAMAAVVASVAAGETVIPHLVDGQQATSKGKPLTDQEATKTNILLALKLLAGIGVFAALGFMAQNDIFFLPVTMAAAKSASV